VSTCFLKIHLFHLSNNLRNYTNNNTLLWRIKKHQIHA
jgi:hypothetical protein